MTDDAAHNLAAAIRDLADAIRATNTTSDSGRNHPANGLRTERRGTPDHRDPNANSRLGFAPVKAGGDQ